MPRDILWKHNESVPAIGRFLSYDRKSGETTIELNEAGIKLLQEAQKMTREEAMTRLNVCLDSGDPEVAHAVADGVLVELLKSLGYADVVEIWTDVKKWYS